MLIVAIVVLLGLAGWVSEARYDSGVLQPGDMSYDCSSKFDIPLDAAGRKFLADFDRACDEARQDRRRTALVWGAGIIVLAAAVSTWPSRRLTDGPGSRAEAATR